MLLQILRTLEGLSAKLALVRLQRNMDANVRRNVVALDGGCPTRSPRAGEAEVICGFAANMDVAEVVL